MGDLLYKVRFAHFLDEVSDKVYLTAIRVDEEGTELVAHPSYMIWGQTGKLKALKMKVGSATEVNRKMVEKVGKRYVLHPDVPLEYMHTVGSIIVKNKENNGDGYSDITVDGTRLIISKDGSEPLAAKYRTPGAWDHGDW